MNPFSTAATRPNCVSLVYILALCVYLAGCEVVDKCAEAMRAQTIDYRASVEACRSDFQQNKRQSSLISLATSLGELADWDGLSELYVNITEPLLQADLKMVGAKYLQRNGKADSAYENYLAAIKVYRDFDRSEELAKALHQAFKIVWRKSDHQAALRFAGEGLQVARDSDNKKYEIAALSNLVKVFQEIGSVGAAQHAIDQKKPLLAEHGTLGQRINAHIYQGLVYLDTENFGLAAFSFEKALTAAAGSGNTNALRGLHLNLVLANVELGRVDIAESHLKQAWSYASSDGSGQFALNFFQSLVHHGKGEFALANASISKAIADKSKPAVWDWEFYYHAGLVANDLGDLARATEYFNKAIGASDTLRESLGFNDLKAHLLSRKREPYEALFLSYWQQGDLQNAFSVAEQAKSKSFIEAYLHSQQAASLHSQEAASFNSQGAPSQALDVAAESQRIDDLLQHLQLMQESPVLTPHSPMELVSKLGDEQILSFFVAQDRLFLISLIDGDIAIEPADISLSALSELIQQYKAQADNTELLARLGDVLLAQFNADHSARHVYISPDELLSDVVFASLVVKQQFLVELKSVSLIPSASALYEIQANSNDGVLAKALVLGNPSSDLPAAQTELVDVAKHLKTNAITGEAALSSVVYESRGAQILHLATHSGVNQLGPWIRFADGDVPAKQIALKGVASQLAVLASCSSAAKAGRNLWGSLGGLFLSSGTPSVFVTQWSVKDEITSKVMSQFYTHLLAGESAAESLALVQRYAIAQNSLPSDWAAYTMLGQ